MKTTLRVSSILMFLILASCSKEPGYQVSKYKQIKISDMPEEVKVPEKAWELLEFKSHESDAHKPDAHAVTAGKNLVFSEVSVYLVEKNSGVIDEHAVKISLPKGGGTIDLSRFVGDQAGSYYVGFEFPEFENAVGKKVLFVSRARKRRLGNEVLGAGCNQLFDITDEYFRKMKLEGLKVNTTQDRHLSVLGGSFLFAAETATEVLLAQVRFTDSQKPRFFCEEH